ncbi:MAG: 3-deoxy-7-phosphoheptulonate synthase [Clostridia bacterium]|nr:3-deoxy-7-phosphoheptulonate synthase [Clostridia bacterium]
MSWRAIVKDFEYQNYIYSRKNEDDRTIINVKGVEIGGDKLTIMAGPCVIDSFEATDKIADKVKNLGASVLRGGAFKPRTSPYSFQGMGTMGLDILSDIGSKHNMPVISEIMSADELDYFVEKIDIIQVGARNMQNFDLLKKLGKTDKPVLLKRGFANTIEEFLLSAEYIMKEGNKNVILCERGIRTYETFTRNTLDISAVPVLKRLTHLPVVVDPSHAAGIHWLVKPLSLAAAAAGADGLIIETHINPRESSCDPEQTLTIESFTSLMNELNPVVKAIGRSI